MIPSPKLDDRKYQDILEEALALLPRYAPDWTNHNPSDPGVTLLELAAWMTDQILFRLNRVPEKNYVSFLNLLGITLEPARAARTILQFSLAKGISRQRVPAQTIVATPQSADAESVQFETVEDVIVTGVPLDRCFSYYNETYSDNSAFVTGEREAEFDIFGGAQRVERFLYLSDPRFAGAGEESVLRVFLGCPERGTRDLARQLEWEYWSGGQWRELTPAKIDVDRGEVCFEGPLTFETNTVNGTEGPWMRGRLAEVPTASEDTEIDIVRARVEVVGEGIMPEMALANISDAYVELDLGKNIMPLGTEPKVDSVLYIACDEVMQTPGAYVSIEMLLGDVASFPTPNASDDLSLVWEYFDGKRWRILGQTSPRGVAPGSQDEHGFQDSTKALSQTGVVRFRRPKDLEKKEIHGRDKQWIRMRVDRGDFGVAGNYTLEHDQWIFKDERPLRPPVLSQINFRYSEEYRQVRHTFAFNDFRFTDFTDQARAEFTIFQPFTPHSEESPALYLGFDGKLPNDTLFLYFAMAEDLGLAGSSEANPIVTGELKHYNLEREAQWNAEQRVVWEYFNGVGWQPLACEDKTKGFTTSGFLRFLGPDDWQSTLKFTEERFWLRARLEMGGYIQSPRIDRLIVNAVAAENYRSYYNETMGSSDGSPSQSFSLVRSPILADEIVHVYEKLPPPDEEKLLLGKDSVIAVMDETTGTEEGYWVVWQRVTSFYESGPRSRHYMFDHQTGKITFGDGRKGMIPPEAKNGVRCRRYRVGGGAQGNVNAGTVTTMRRSISHIDDVTNPLPARGGADRERVEEAKERAPYTIKSRDRAVTHGDFEMLALRASSLLARARCVPDKTHRGAVTLVVIPKSDNSNLKQRLLPSNEVLRYVKRYLDERRLVGSLLHVVKPRYKDVSIKITLLRRTIGTADRLRQEIEDIFRRYLHPLVGGSDRQGWAFGYAVRKTELIRVVEEVPGVEGVDSLALLDEGRGIHVEHVRMEEDELPHLVHVRVVEKVRDEIM